jgi:hypothetical protein
VFIALQAPIGAPFFFQSLFDDLLDRGDDNILHLEAAVCTGHGLSRVS